MNEFDILKENWKEQPVQKPSAENFAELKGVIAKITKKQKGMNAILFATIVALVIFFIYVGAINSNHAALAIGVMILALVIRIGVEVFSIKRIKKASGVLNIQVFKQKLKQYYKERIVIHTILTPILIAIYSYAFWTLFPDFKATLSKGFYNYIVYSSGILLCLLLLLIFFQVRKELRLLKELNAE
ncbi:NAD(P)(+) transhydrogenase (Re/Si-specific) subunit beta [Croceivirga thetidis]|uniref:NAD(P)(+) transhydrogenase (Re/Si-specific) subunit beta n=1 Tax=Croceivirga thetidis TaxID=2721623 RepID=A0ABX1GQ42_9FLAO|nr:NAD(P)(+) transhydrogenase (Re/Si-specific) subunit beta [Croceivirga thetidis]NKI31161.1 NAD(P)(+) transhydrogenase (Re/Si-specific) subunit beta [Croceivirga thetidis]